MLDAEQTAILDTYKRVQQAMIDKDIETLDELYLDGATFRHMSGKVQAKEEFFGEIADKIIKNTYRTLMTRGMKGCYVYCTDTSLAEYLKASLARLNK